MNIYFCSAYPCAIKINGVFFSRLHLDVLPCKIEEEPFIEVCSLLGGETNKNFFIDEEFLLTPPEYVSVVDLKGGYLLRFNKKNDGGEFKIISQERLNICLVTVFNENGRKISVETQNGFFAENVNFDFSSVQFAEHNFCGRTVLCVLFKSEISVLRIYLLHGEITKIFERCLDDYLVSQTLTTIENKCDIAKHTVTTEWKFTGEGFIFSSRSSSARKPIETNAIPDKILPYAFLEEFSAGGNFKDFLCENMQKNSDKLSGYLGEFIGIMPPPLFRNAEEVGLVYKLKENSFEVKYFTFYIENGKIGNIIPSQ